MLRVPRSPHARSRSLLQDSAIVRCAQPLVGMAGKRSVADETYLEDVIKARTPFKRCSIAPRKLVLPL